MFSPPAHTTFSSFFSRAVGLWARSEPPPTSWVTPPPRPALEDAPRQPPPGPGRLNASDALLHWVHTTQSFFSPGPGFSLVLGFSVRASPLRPCSPLPSPVSGAKMSQAIVSGLFDDTVSADRRLLTFSSAIVVFLFRPNKTPKLQLSPVSGARSQASAR